MMISCLPTSTMKTIRSLDEHREAFSFFIHRPELLCRPTRMHYLPGDTIIANAEFTNLTLTGFSAIARIRLVELNGTKILEEERSVVMPSYGASLIEAMFVVPENLPRGKYVVIASLATGSDQIATANISVDVDSLFSRIYVVPDLPRPFRVGLNNVSFTVTNAWMLPINNGSLEINLQDPHGSSIFQNSYPFYPVSRRNQGYQYFRVVIRTDFW